MSGARGVVAAGHAESARAGAAALRAGGNAVDAALGAMLAALTCEPLLTGLGAGGYMLVVTEGAAPVLLDFFVEAPGRDGALAGELLPVEVSFGDAVQIFHVGPASAGAYGFPAGVCEASRRFGTIPLAELAAPAARLARDGVPLSPEQAYIVEILGPTVLSTPECAALFAPEGRLLGVGDRFRQPEVGDAIQRLGSDGCNPFYTGDIGAAITAWLRDRGGLVSAADLAAYEVVVRDPLRVRFRGREVLTNPPPAPGGLLLAGALAELDRAPSPPPVTAIADAMQSAQDARTVDFLRGLAEPGFAAQFLGRASRLGSTTHVAALDADGGACSVTCSNGSASGVVVPGTGIHLNNMLGESDLNPEGFHRHPPGDRMPSMMSPTVLLRDGHPELAVGSAGSNRIRSAILQTILRCVDEGMSAQEAVRAPRIHYEDGVVFAEPGIDATALEQAGRTVRRFRAPNLFFGGAQAAERHEDGGFSGGGDPRRGGAAVVV
ncbi:MAG TPA: gamma-glutamyltransferase [Solirubrobacteraceae bacterium]|jgi:gamma-glutamyltranspeptidase/glutathione hydrolase